jgi:DNA-binding response OmpR family regulator
MGDRRRILVVDDEAELRRLLAWILTDFGHDVETAVDGDEALTRLPHAPAPDLVILDILMPRVDGWAVLRALRELAVQPPVLVLTGMVDYPTFLRAVREGAAAFMVKPFRFQDLIGLCQRLLARAGEAPAQERRQTARRLLITDVDLLSAEGTPLARGDLVNVSLSGARLDLGVPLEEGRRVRLAVNVPGQARPFRLDAVVQWQRPVPTGFAHGLCFHTLGPEEERFVQEIVEP